MLASVYGALIAASLLCVQSLPSEQVLEKGPGRSGQFPEELWWKTRLKAVSKTTGYFLRRHS